MSGERTFIVRLSRTETKTVVMSGANSIQAMDTAERVFAGWDVIDATEASAPFPTPAEQAEIQRFGIFADEEAAS